MQLPIFDLMNNIEAGDRTSFEIAFGNCHLQRSGHIIYNVNPVVIVNEGMPQPARYWEPPKHTRLQPYDAINGAFVCLLRPRTKLSSDHKEELQ